ncbi:hypothetical protein OG897_13250 [Streptomyces sp. NBC_00237]|uniref:hypothetical protein n=1 Tax=Streptomyces sp. NBC_00237 TaxID=2975687 RepID=UPI00224E12F3|nr:hypothetical protein [Streptomyces sp. NBC_00237]MCX5202409.1 hypothetical protein [Streptomyces sp. NBC_00237]
MIASPRTNRPIPDRVLRLIGSHLPDRIVVARRAASDAYVSYTRCRTPFTAEARERALAELARANKTLAAYNPGLVVTAGGAR